MVLIWSMEHFINWQFICWCFTRHISISTVIDSHTHSCPTPCNTIHYTCWCSSLLLFLSLGLPSCSDFQTDYQAVSGYYYIDPDGHGTGADSFEVYCDMSYAPPITILENHAACGNTYRELTGYHNYYSKPVNVSYRYDYSDEQLEALIDSSSMTF